MNEMKGKTYVVAVSVAITAMILAYKFPAEIFIAFVAGWIFGIPILFVGYLISGLWVYRKDIKNSIIVRIKPSKEMQSIMRREEEIRKEKIYIMKNN